MPSVVDQMHLKQFVDWRIIEAVERLVLCFSDIGLATYCCSHIGSPYCRKGIEEGDGIGGK